MITQLIKKGSRGPQLKIASADPAHVEKAQNYNDAVDVYSPRGRGNSCESVLSAANRLSARKVST